MSITKEQSRAARGLLGWTQMDLSAASDVSQKSIADFETGARNLRPRTVADIRRALEDGGVDFIDENGGGPGVRLRKK